MAKNSVLFVCLGNICRSPIAEAIMHDLTSKKGVRDQWLIDSAGTGGHEAGNPIYGSAQKVLNKNGINYQHTARKIKPEDYDKFDLILGFDTENIRNLERMKPKNSKAQVKLLTFYNPNGKNQNIEDPWYDDTPQAFDKVFKDSYDSCVGILNSL